KWLRKVVGSRLGLLFDCKMDIWLRGNHKMCPSPKSADQRRRTSSDICGNRSNGLNQSGVNVSMGGCGCAQNPPECGDFLPDLFLARAAHVVTNFGQDLSPHSPPVTTRRVHLDSPALSRQRGAGL